MGGFRPHSLQAYFLRPGANDEPHVYTVERLRDSRSFATRRVVARQEAGTNFAMTASFQLEGADDEIADAQLAIAPKAPPPEPLPETGWTPLYSRRPVASGSGRGRQLEWLRINEDLGDDPLLHACALAFLSDDAPGDAVLSYARSDRGEVTGPDDLSIWNHSLDHAVWFHRPGRADRWQLHECTCDSLAAGRGVATGKVYDEDGVHLATLAQENLLRPLRLPSTRP
jgi:acyl-CoA thioesterase-2